MPLRSYCQTGTHHSEPSHLIISHTSSPHITHIITTYHTHPHHISHTLSPHIVHNVTIYRTYYHHISHTSSPHITHHHHISYTSSPHITHIYHTHHHHISHTSSPHIRHILTTYHTHPHHISHTSSPHEPQAVGSPGFTLLDELQSVLTFLNLLKQRSMIQDPRALHCSMNYNHADFLKPFEAKVYDHLHRHYLPTSTDIPSTLASRIKNAV